VLAGCSRGVEPPKARVAEPTPSVWKPPPVSLPSGLTLEEATRLVEESDAFRKPKIAKCPKGVDRHNLEYWRERYPALGILTMLEMATLTEPQSDPLGSQDVQLTDKGRAALVGLEEDSAWYLIPIATRMLVAIKGSARRDDGGYNLDFDWKYVPNEIGVRLSLRKWSLGGTARIENGGGAWRATDVYGILDVPFGPDDR
jgi:hypothetical protein